MSDLSARIKMINLQNKWREQSAANSEEKEKVAEARLQETLADSPKEEAPVAPMPEKVVLSRVGEMRDYEDLVAKVEELTAEIKKMNKHILSIQKYIKKG